MKENKKNEIPMTLLAFTFFYAISIYLLLLGYHYWSQNRDLEAIEESEN